MASEVAGSKAASAADAVLLVYVHFSGCFIEDQAAVGTFLLAAVCNRGTYVLLDTWFSAAVLRRFFPAREPQPMPMFLIVPPKPVVSCPLK